MHERRGVLLVVLSLVAVLVAPGCGGDETWQHSSTGGAGGTGGTGGGSAAGGTGGGLGGGITGSEPGDPVILYTDLSSAPPRAYVTLYGRRFGAAQDGSTVSLAGQPVAGYPGWSDRMIELQLGDDASAGDLVVHTTAGDSPPYALGVHPGALYFVASDGDDAYSGLLESPSGGDGPFSTLQRGRDALTAGDVLYLRQGSFTAEDNYGAILSLRDVPTGTAAAPVAIVVYPGETATLGDNTLERSISLYRGDGGPTLDYLTIAKLTLRPSCNAVRVSQANYTRLVGNEIYGATDACMSGTIAVHETRGLQVLGNHIHDNGNSKFEHGIYLGGYGHIHAFEVAFNRIHEQAGGRGIQLFGHKPGDVIELGTIHDNEVWETDRDGIVLGNTDADVLTLRDLTLYNNIFYRAGRCTGWAIRVNNPTAERIDIVHNTMVDNGSGVVSCHQSSGSVQEQLTVQVATSVTLRNNVMVAQGGEGYADAADPAVIDASHDLYFGAGAPPSWDSAAISGDPALIDPAGLDFHLGPASAAVDAGTAVELAIDHDGVSRPQGAAPDVGAYEQLP